MTIATQVSKISYAGNGVTTAFAVPFPFAKDDDIYALLLAEGEESALVQGTHYALAGAGEATGGTLTMLSAPVSGQKLVIYRAPAIVQEVDYVENAAFPAETHEAALDLLTMICQSLQEQIDRAVLYPVSTATADILDSTDFLDTTAASRDEASNSAAESAASATAAASSASTAASQAANAATSATEAAASAATASTGAGVITTNLAAISSVADNIAAIQDAEANATAAATSADNAAGSASSAAGSAADAASSASAAAASASAAAETVSSGLADASTSTKGKVQLATDADALAGTNTAKAVTPANLKAATVGLSLFTAAWDMVVGSGTAAVIKKSFAEFWTYLTTFSTGAWSKQQYMSLTSLGTLTTALTLDANTQPDVYAVIGASLTVNAPTNAGVGKTLFLTFTAGGAYTLTWNSAFAGTDDCTLPTSLTSGKTYYMQFRYDGSAWVLLGITSRG